MKQVLGLTAVVALSLVLGACGDSGKGANVASNAASSPSTATTARVTSPQVKAIVEYGQEASPTDKQAITALVKRYYAAVAADDGATACSLIHSPLAESVAEDYGQAPGPVSLSGKTCAVVMSKLFRQLPEQPASVLAATEVTGVRVKDRKGFALLHSTAIPEGDIPVERELGVWRVGTLVGGALPGTKAPAPPPERSKMNTHSNYEDPGTPQVKDTNDSDDDPHSNDDEAVIDYGHAASPADEQAIATLVKRYYAATSATNGTAICSLIYNVVAETIPEDYEASAEAKGATCAEVMAKVFARRHRQVVRELRDLRVTRVRVEGVKAIAMVYVRKHPNQYFLVHRQGPAWKMQTMFTTGLP
jgi:hypothetical protein